MIHALRQTFIIAALSLNMVSLAGAQTLSLDGNNGDQPVTIEAQNGIEWLRDEQTYVARGNAQVNRGDVSIKADVLTAYYRATAGTETEIYQIEAVGNVVLTSPNQQARGKQLLYDMDKAVISLTGGPVEFKTKDQVLTANDSLSYWPRKQTAIAKGRARVTQSGRLLTADILTAYFQEDADGNVTIHQVFADGDVQIETKGETATGNKGAYDARTDTATLTGDVRLIRGNDQLQGSHAEVDFTTGISRLLARKNTDRVRGVFTPKPKTKRE